MLELGDRKSKRRKSRDTYHLSYINYSSQILLLFVSVYVISQHFFQCMAKVLYHSRHLRPIKRAGTRSIIRAKRLVVSISSARIHLSLVSVGCEFQSIRNSSLCLFDRRRRRNRDPIRINETRLLSRGCYGCINICPDEIKPCLLNFKWSFPDDKNEKMDWYAAITAIFVRRVLVCCSIFRIRVRNSWAIGSLLRHDQMEDQISID